MTNAVARDHYQLLVAQRATDFSRCPGPSSMKPFEALADGRQQYGAEVVAQCCAHSLAAGLRLIGDDRVTHAGVRAASQDR
jgi:hypothetical protein